MKLDILITTAHPDDAEFSMGGTILKLIGEGKRVGIADFTRGELGTRGSAEIRDAEAAEADLRLNLTTRVNLGFRDGFFIHDEVHVLKIIELIRRFQPEMIFSNPPSDRHPDHGRAHSIVKEAIFLSGLPKIITHDQTGNPQEAWRPARHFYYIQSCQHEPDFVVDITPFWERKCHAIRAYQSQFHCEKYETEEPHTRISQQGFWESFEGRARAIGRDVGATYAEGFLSEKVLKIDDVLSLI